MLVMTAELGRWRPHFHGVRVGLVLEQGETLLTLGERLRDMAPVALHVLARLRVVLRDTASPVYVNGRKPAELHETLARCLDGISGVRP